MTEVAGSAHPFSGHIVYRQVVDEHHAILWRPSHHPWRWNLGFPALCTSLELNVAITERLKSPSLWLSGSSLDSLKPQSPGSWI
jgi:hypothetical protein